MRLRDWTPRTLARVWLIALGIQCLFLLPWASEQYRLHRPTPPRTDTTTTSFRDLVARMDSAERARLVRLFRDSLGVVLALEGDSLTGVTLTPRTDTAVKELVGQVSRSMVDAMEGLGPIIAMIVVVMFSPTVAAVALTLAWVWARRRGTVESGIADV